MVSRLWAFLLVGLLGGIATAQERGFALDRYDGTTAGSTQFLIERPWYTSTRYFAVGLTADYLHDPLVPKVATGRGPITPIVAHALVGHLDIAGSLFDRVLVSASLPLTLLERGSAEPVSQVAPLQGVGLGDPRVGAMVRLFGQPDRDAFSAHLGADLWIPIGGQGTHQGDLGVRVLPRVVLAGSFADVVQWTLNAGFLYRPYASYGPPQLGMTAASELRVGLAVGLALADRRVYLGPEAQFATQVVGDNAFAANGTSLELLAGAHFLIGGQVQLGVAAGTGVFGAAGTPDVRGVVRLAWAPRREPEVVFPGDDAGPIPEEPDADHDGVPDSVDRCPFEPETRNGIRDADGCPEFRLEPGSPLARVLTASGATRVDAGTDAGTPRLSERGAPGLFDGGAFSPDAGVPAFSTVDSDGDGVPDDADRCPVTPEDRDGFEDEDGCPEPDNDGDGIADAKDACPDVAETMNGVEDEDGCPDVAPDADADGVPDSVDRCPFEPETIDGVRDEDGCPEGNATAVPALAKILAPLTHVSTAAPDSDGDGVPDDADRCPVTPEDRDGFEDEDGCPEPDNDGDGIADARDQCPDAAETVNGYKDDDGCPDENPDLDGDGVDYANDRCPLEPGSPLDGCPHAPLPALAIPGFPGAPKAGEISDFDHDGVPDDIDLCPLSPEDRDGFEDEDGCPELDNDRDGIADRADKCPLEAESINGIKDDDGCPDVGEVVVHVRPGAVVVDRVIQFKPGAATLMPSALPLLKQVAATLRAASTLSVEVQGHTDDTGSAVTNIALSKKRAETIRTFLIKAGIATPRLIAKGFGPTRPVATNLTSAGREQNRRVEFLILGEVK